jgi:hypothetical protein
MRTNTAIAFAVALVFGIGALYVPARSQNATQPQKTQQGPGEVTPPDQKTTPGQSGDSRQLGGMDELTNQDYDAIVKDLDQTIQRMTAIVQQAKAFSTTFDKLAALHEGADKSEVLMMKRMSDSMATMAGEIKMSAEQYKRMVGDESATQSGQMRQEVQRLKSIIDGAAKNVEKGMQTLQDLQVALGQG